MALLTEYSPDMILGTRTITRSPGSFISLCSFFRYTRAAAVSHHFARAVSRAISISSRTISFSRIRSVSAR